MLEQYKKQIGSFFTKFASLSKPLTRDELKLFIAKYLVRQTSFALREIEMQVDAWVGGWMYADMCAWVKVRNGGEGMGWR